MSSAKGTHKKATPKKGSPAATPEKKPATKRQGTMEGTAKEGKRFLAAQAKGNPKRSLFNGSQGTSTMKLRKGSKEVDRDVQHILSEVALL